MRYSDAVMDHFMNPRNAGRPPDADGLGILGSEECGDQLRVWIKVRNGQLVSVQHQVFGCPAAIACCSMMSQLATGLTLQEAMDLTDDAVAAALGGLPPQKMHCSNLAASALHEAIRNYQNGQSMTDQVHITLLVNNQMPLPLQAEHGLSFWIEYRGQNILFDTGQSNALLHNADLLDIDVSKTDAVVLSHGHYDHTGGLNAVLERAPNATIYLHPNAPKIRYSCRAGQSPKNISMPPAACQKLAKQVPKAAVIYTPEPECVAPGVTVSGSIPRRTDFEDTGGPFYLDTKRRRPDLLEDDQALFITTSKGLIVILGCCHAGLVNTLNYASELTGQSIVAVLGGTHLRSASGDRLERTCQALTKRNIQQIAPCHCTGRNAVELFQNRFPHAFLDFQSHIRIAI